MREEYWGRRRGDRLAKHNPAILDDARILYPTTLEQRDAMGRSFFVLLAEEFNFHGVGFAADVAGKDSVSARPSGRRIRI